MDARWSEGIGMVKSMEEKKAIRVQKPQALACPRCNSSHTKFCYYNNYNLSQPRYFCKTCRRYWTAGGSLRNVPVGGGSRKNKRSSPKINHHSMIMPQPSSANLVSQNLNHEQITPNTHGAQDHQLMAFFKSGGNDYARGTSMMMMNTCLDVFHNNNSDQDNDRIIRAVSSTTATVPSASARLFFPMEDLKPAALASTSENHQVQAESSCNAYGVDHTY